MTSPAEPASTDATQASQLTKPLREPVALVLIGANALLLFVGLIRLLVPPNEYSTFTSRAQGSFYSFVGVEAIVLPVLAVLLATHLTPVLPRAKLITQAALGEFAFGALFGVLTFLVGVFGRLAEAQFGEAFRFLLSAVAYLAVFGVAGFVVHKIWRTLYFVPKPKRQSGVYGQAPPGQAHPGWPQQQHPGQGGYPQQPGPYGAPYGYPANPAPGGQYGAAPTVSPVNPAPASAPPYGVPQQSAPPYGVPQQSAPPFTPAASPPFGPRPSADPTQAIGRQPGDPYQGGGHPETEGTQRFDPGDDPYRPR